MNQYDVIGETQLQGYAAPQVFAGGHPVFGRHPVFGQRSGTNGLVVHQPQTGGALDSVKEWLDKRSVANLPNKYLVAGAAIAGILVYGYKERWF